MKHPPAIVVQLIHLTGPFKQEIQEFPGGVISIGRHPSCHLRFPADLAAVSRKQAEIVREGNQFRLIDHSTNGTLVNGKPVREAVLKNGDVLEFSPGGPKVSFLTELREAPLETAEPSPPRRDPSVEPAPVTRKPPKEEMTRTPPPGKEPEEIPVSPSAVPLVVQFGPTLRSFRQLPVTIGKSEQCEFLLDSPGILDLHAQIFFSQDRYWLKDLTGQGTIKINHQPVISHTPLDRDDHVALTPRGPFFRFLGEGRLAEVSEGNTDAPTASSGKRRGESTHPDHPDATPPKGLLSRFRKDR